MRLTHVSIENFRGIPALDVELGRLTVIIGENNHGKTSLFDLLARCLGGSDGEVPAWEYGDFRRDAEGRVAGPIRVVLTFTSDGGASAASITGRLLDAATAPDGEGRPALRVGFYGRPGSGAMETFLLDGAGLPLGLPGEDLILRRLRQLHPFLLVRLNQPSPDEELEWVSRSDRRDFDATDGDDAEEVITQVYHRLTRTRGAIPTDEVRRGLQAARHLGARMGGDGAGGPEGAVGRMLERFLADADGEAPAPGGGSGSHSLGLLMVLGSLLQARGNVALDAEAQPIIAIEEPEVHLHPMLLSSTWDVIESLRAQTVVTTNSGEFLSEVPLRHLRRLVRRDGRIDAYRLRPGTLTPEALRRVQYHVRAKRGGTLFARCWLLVEGETEYWLLREMARVLGYDLEAEGVRCVEFAQCGVAPLVLLANDLGIAWHLLSDGDDSGVAFAEDAAAHLGERPRRDHVTRLERRNMEMLLWHEGFSQVYLEAAGLPVPVPGSEEEARLPTRKVVARAIRAHSKPYLALLVAEESARRGPESVPEILRRVIDRSVRLAREAVTPS